MELDYTIASVLFPAILSGATTGLLIYPFLPEPVVLVMLVMLIIGAALKSILTAIKRWKSETATLLALENEAL